MEEREIILIIFLAILFCVFVGLSAYNFGKADGSKKAANDWNKLLEEVQKNNTGIIGEYKELIHELMLTIENKTKIIEELKKLHIEKKEPVQRLWKVGDKYKHWSVRGIAKIKKISNNKVLMYTESGLYLGSYSVEEVDKYFNEGIWILLKDTDPVEGC